MNTRLPYLTLYSIIVYFSCIISAFGSLPPSTDNGTYLCGYGEQQMENRRYARALANHAVGTPRTVRLVYFLPADRHPRKDIEEKMDALIKNVREFYANQMENYGYGRRTFDIESDRDGRAVVHRVNGQFTDTYYYDDETFPKVWREIHDRFDTSQNIYLAVVDVGNEQIGEVAGIATPFGDWGGIAVIPASGAFFDPPLAAHELGHAFGLEHDFRSSEYIMSYGPWGWGRTTRLSVCSAKWLEIHRYFNPGSELRPGNFPTIELVSPRTYTAGATRASIQLRVSDYEGLHQVLLLVSDHNVSTCHGFAGEQNSLVEIDYDGEYTDRGFTSFTDRSVHPIRARVVDTDGNVNDTSFYLFPESLQTMTKIAGDDQPPGLPNTRLPVPLVVELRNVNDGSPYKEVWVSFTVTAGSGRLSETQVLTDDYGRAVTVFTLGPHPGTNAVEVSALGYTTTFNAVAGSPVNVPNSLLRSAITRTLNKVSGEPISQAEMATLTSTARMFWSLGISDLTGLEFAINLTYLDLGHNPLTDISPLTELTKLTQLALDNNFVSDISALAGLPKLTQLTLANNSIEDISPLATLTTLEQLLLGNNAISDISPIAKLTNLQLVYLEDNNIKDVSPLKRLVHLRAVQLAGNSVSDLSPLAESQGLEAGTQIDVRKNPLNYPSIKVHIPTLQGRGVEIYFDNRTPVTLKPISGDDQESLPGKALADPFVIEVKDEDGLVFEGVPVTFTVTTGGGTLVKRSTTTDSNGRAENVLTLGKNPGTNTVRASVKTISQSVTFNAEGIQAPKTLLKISGDDQEGFPGETLPNPLVVQVKDQFDNPLRDVRITFAITAGGGTLTATTTKTDRNGKAESKLALGPNAGTNTVSVSASGIEQSEVFNAEGIRTPGFILKISGDSQEGLPGTTLTNSIVVEVQDKTGSPLEGIPVTFAVIAGEGSLDVTSTETASNGRAESTLTLGLSPGTLSVEASAEGVDTTVIFSVNARRREFTLSVPSGISLIHVPLKVSLVDGVAVALRSVGDLHDALGGTETVNLLTTRDSQRNRWHNYLGDMSRGTIADPPLTDDIGIVASMRKPVELHLAGNALGEGGTSTIRLQPGMNLVGVPLRDSRITRVSDLLTLEGIRGNVPTVSVLVDGNLKVVARAGDDGDIPVTGDLSFFMAAQFGTTVSISGEGWGDFSPAVAAPPSVLTGIHVQKVSPVLFLTGTIFYVGEGRENNTPLTRSELSVIVKNLTTGKAHTTLATKGDALQSKRLGYQLTVVEAATVGAAQVGDILEISVQSPNPLIRVEPLRHTVTPTDLKDSQIELSELVAYAIPTETTLLMNYPNPFNPETWIPYQLAEEAIVTLTIYDARGALVRRLEIGHQSAGYYTTRGRAVYWDGRNESGEPVASGLYFYQLGTPSFRQLRRMVVLK